MKSGGGALMDQHGGGGGDDNSSDLFGSGGAASTTTTSPNSRAYGFVTKLRPTMISAKYRLKEERRKVLKISINKLRKIEDPESSLRRSVLINNTMKRLQREAREEKLQKQYPNRCYNNSRQHHDTTSSTVSSNNPLPSAASSEANKENASPFIVADYENDHKPSQDHHEIENVVKPVSRLVVCDETIDELVDVTGDQEEDNNNTTTTTISAGGTTTTTTTTTAVSSSTPSRKRSFDEVEDCDVHDVLSQFYMPPTPRMLTSIDDTDDEDEDVNVVDIDIVTPDMTLSSALQSSGVLTPEQDLPSERPRLSHDDIVTPDMTLSSALQSSGVLAPEQDMPSKRPRLLHDDGTSAATLDLEMSLSSALHPVSSALDGQNVSKRPRFDDEDNDDEVNVVDIEMSLPSSLHAEQNDCSKRARFEEDDPVVVGQECDDRLCRTIIPSAITAPLPPSSALHHVEPEDPDDIEVVLEDNEDVERRLFLCSSVNRTRSTRSEEDVVVVGGGAGSPHQIVDSCWRSQQPPSEHCGAMDTHPLRFDSILPNDTNSKNVMSQCANFCLGNTNNNNNNSSNGMVLDTTEQQYSCGHSSIFGEIQSVVYHSLIASLES